MVNEIKNQDSIKVDDIFYTDRHCGVKGHCIQFFQVVALKENNQVIVREVERKLDSHNGENKALVIPSIIMSPLTSNNKESISTNAYLWDGQPKCHYNDLFEYINEEKI